MKIVASKFSLVAFIYKTNMPSRLYLYLRYYAEKMFGASLSSLCLSRAPWEHSTNVNFINLTWNGKKKETEKNFACNKASSKASMLQKLGDVSSETSVQTKNVMTQFQLQASFKQHSHQQNKLTAKFFMMSPSGTEHVATGRCENASILFDLTLWLVKKFHQLFPTRHVALACVNNKYLSQKQANKSACINV